MRLLYVEDELSMARAVEILFRKQGYAFDTAACGQDAVRLATTNDYDLVILDIMLPDIDGYEVIERIRRRGTNAQFLIQTGLIADGEEALAASLGVSDYLMKPFTQTELIKRIDQFHGRAALVERTGLEPEEATRNGGRAHARFKSRSPARIIGVDGCDCKVMNISKGGAALRLPHPQKRVPPSFAMTIDSQEIQCEVCWRLGDKVGVRFV